jgi:hypothetical protein
MGELIDLTLLQAARRLLKARLEAEGLDSFLSRGGKQWFQIAPKRVEDILSCAAGEAARVPSAKTLEVVRREVRRELIRRVACAMVQTGF